MKIYYRKSVMPKEELEVAQQYFECVPLISQLTDCVDKDPRVICRYSLYPFASDIIKEISYTEHRHINSYNQFLYCVDFQNYYYDLEGLTPKTWDSLVGLKDEDGPFVLKGETNSRKSDWDRKMFASNVQSASEIHSELCQDSLIGSQKIFIRQYVPLVSYGTGIGGIPISKEFRFFVAFGEILAGSFYWQNHLDEGFPAPSVDEVPQDFLQSIVQKVGDSSNFFVMDVAQTQSGEWILIELNDGSSSGTSDINLHQLYGNLAKVAQKKLVWF